jgi:hypothetical protein
MAATAEELSAQAEQQKDVIQTFIGNGCANNTGVAPKHNARIQEATSLKAMTLQPQRKQMISAPLKPMAAVPPKPVAAGVMLDMRPQSGNGAHRESDEEFEKF